jgi:hypothetical protein
VCPKTAASFNRFEFCVFWGYSYSDGTLHLVLPLQRPSPRPRPAAMLRPSAPHWLQLMHPLRASACLPPLPAPSECSLAVGNRMHSSWGSSPVQATGPCTATLVCCNASCRIGLRALPFCTHVLCVYTHRPCLQMTRKCAQKASEGVIRSVTRLCAV